MITIDLTKEKEGVNINFTGNVIHTQGGEDGKYATKEYVDEKIKKIEIPNTNNLETKNEAQNKLKEAKSYTDNEIKKVVDNAPESLNTLNKLATATNTNKESIKSLDSAVRNKVGKSYVDENFQPKGDYLTKTEAKSSYQPKGNYVPQTIFEQAYGIIKESFNAKQDKLISGESLKTINGQSLLGSGNIEIAGGSGEIDLSEYETKIDSEAKLQEAKSYTDNKTDELRDVVTQTLSLISGTDWYSFYVDITLEQLQQALGTNATTITTSFDGTTEVTSSYDADTNTWSGDLTTLDVTKMYMIAVNTDCEISLTGRKIPNSTSYTLNPGFNWIGFPSIESINVTDAFAQVQNNDEDYIKSKDKYVGCAGGYWDDGSLQSMEPGKGYIYYNASESVKNLIYTIKSIDVKSELSKKQNTLVSGTNIKTVNGESLLGEGNIVVSGGESDMSNYYTKEEIDNTVGNINTILESIING